jgi:alginate O-acetyltransferase complex protein AlgJ
MPAAHQPAPPGAGRRTWCLATVAMFVAALCLPGLQSFSHLVPSVDLAENRRPAPAPSYDGHPVTYARKWAAHFDAQFGLRDVLVRWDTLARRRLLGALPVSKLIAGSDGWIFYESEKVHDGNTIADHRGLSPYTTAQLDAIAATLLSRQRWCREHGAEYLLVVVPNKETIYPEFLPGSLRRSWGDTRLDQVVRRLGADQRGLLVDLRPALQAAKAACPLPLYNKGGTHWNGYGGYYGYRAIIGTASAYLPGLRAIDIEAFDVQVTPASDDDHWLGLPENQRVQLVPKDGRLPAPRIGLKLLVIHDSFWEQLAPLFVLHFSQMTAVHVGSVRDGLHALVEREQPALILQITAERYEDAAWRE